MIVEKGRGGDWEWGFCKSMGSVDTSENNHSRICGWGVMWRVLDIGIGVETIPTREAVA